MCLCATAQPSLICHIFQLHFKQFISYFGPCPFLTPALINHHCTQVIRTKTTHERHWRGHYFQALCLSFDSNISAKRSKKFESGWDGATFIGGKVSGRADAAIWGRRAPAGQRWWWRVIISTIIIIIITIITIIIIIITGDFGARVELNHQEPQEIERESCDRQSIPICNCPAPWPQECHFFRPVVKYFEKNLVKVATRWVVHGVVCCLKDCPSHPLR